MLGARRFHTAFIQPGEPLTLNKPEIDNCHKDLKHHKLYPKDFTVQVFFDHVDEDTLPEAVAEVAIADTAGPASA